ncbi:Clp protease N-terminal domain-containing protein [Candidatus Mycobacterium methanotrophicum]|uniref:Clp R domain-containing protein n=1 Tax=Candidatus Mycobacterium methanotrophicum TaxID=2943498 RepID=A0ABY4QNI8_9MYCO|nr:Clp protease N-terminal domain-containing protein [Candidatus Mycobacterium methanotrophicum]UQX11349.1 hypothetical protein M5I08_02120 [Candidatus Mycobacterium methanotrophicum]
MTSALLGRLLETAEREAKRLEDSYISVEHLVLMLAKEGSAAAAGRILASHGITRESFLKALTAVRGNQRVTPATPEAPYQALKKDGPVYGARPLRCHIAREAQTCIGRALLRGDIVAGAKIQVNVANGELAVSCSEPALAT